MGSADQKSPDADELRLKVAELEARLEQASSELAGMNRRKAELEEALRQSEATLRSLFRAARIGIGLVKDRVIGWVNAEMSTITGRPSDELRGQDARILYPSDAEYERVGRLMHAEVLRSGVGSIETRWIMKSGEIRNILLSSACLDPAASDEGLVFTALDITESKKAEKELVRSEADYRSLIRNAVYGIYRSNRAGRFLEVNPALVRMLGYSSREELLEADIAHDVYRDAEERSALIDTVGDLEVITGIEANWKKRDGTPITVRTSGRMIRGSDGIPQGWEMIVQDITERRALENQLRQSQKLEAVGRLAGGIAHDFNNLLTAIGGYAELIRSAVQDDEQLLPRVDGIRDAAGRAAKLTMQLLAFSRKQPLTAESLNFNEVLRRLAPMIRQLVGEGIELDLALDRGLGSVRADRGQVEQIVMNLVVNARDAMPSGGTLTIRTRNGRITNPETARRLDVAPGDYARLDVVDTGVGMTPEVTAKAFEPFFTTKARGRGTGLGLSMVYGIAKQSGGAARVKSEPEKGTTLTVLLPLSDAPAIAVPREISTSRPSPTAGTVLVVEDEPAVRELVTEVLSSAGLSVLSAGSGEEAFAISDDHTGRIDLLLSDVVLPGPNGPEIATELLNRRPDLSVVFMSGYTGNEFVRRADEEARFPLIEKPFSAEELIRQVRSSMA